MFIARKNEHSSPTDSSDGFFCSIVDKSSMTVIYVKMLIVVPVSCFSSILQRVFERAEYPD